jgi:rhamnopyranosyl-N-acetylglucosaminyl-diphospho-decaprenol beta-1,3/1,4-galactofuranosyltransferase
MPAVIAVVPTYNRKALLVECLKAIFSQTVPVAGVVVVDNASSDGTDELLRKRGLLADPRVDYLRCKANGGSSGGYHEGVKRAYLTKADWIWLMDDDAIPTPDALEA